MREFSLNRRRFTIAAAAAATTAILRPDQVFGQETAPAQSSPPAPGSLEQQAQAALAKLSPQARAEACGEGGARNAQFLANPPDGASGRWRKGMAPKDLRRRRGGVQEMPREFLANPPNSWQTPPAHGRASAFPHSLSVHFLARVSRPRPVFIPPDGDGAPA